MPTKYLTLAEIAERAGIGVASAREYHKRATRNRDAGDVRPGDLPAPDIVLGLTPGWSERSIAKWLERRPRAGKRDA